MPQDIPIEASEELAFTPDCLKDFDDAPVFWLRAATPRDRRHKSLLHNEERLKHHDDAAFRAAFLAALKDLWSPEDFEAHSERLNAYWEYCDNFAMARTADPDTKWDFDPEEEKRVLALIENIKDASPEVAKMEAADRRYREMTLLISAALVVKKWTGLKVTRKIDRGYLSIDCAEELADALIAYAAKCKIELPVLAYLQLVSACNDRFNLNEEEVGNSASPSPSSPNPEPLSETTTSAKAGKSPASAPSSPTPESA